MWASCSTLQTGSLVSHTFLKILLSAAPRLARCGVIWTIVARVSIAPASADGIANADRHPSSIVQLAQQSESQPDPAAMLEASLRLATQGDAEQASRLFYDALSRPLNDSLLAAVYLDVKDLLGVEEGRSYQSAVDKARWLQRFWRRADPTPATLANERFVEHYRRLAYVRKRYRSPQPRGYDDRGMIYLRYGPPDDTFLSSMGEFTRGNESWVYHRLGDVNFDFVEYGGLYRLAYDLREAIASAPSDTHDLVHQWFRLFEERQQLSLLYQITAEYLRGGGPPQRAERIIVREFNVRKLQRQYDLPRHTTDFQIEEKPLRFAVSVASFSARHFQRGGKPPVELRHGRGFGTSEADRTRLEVYYGVPLEQLASENLFNEKDPLRLDLHYSVLTKDYEVVVQDRARRTLDSAWVVARDDFVGQFTCFLAPDTYRVAIDLRIPGKQRRGMTELLVAVPPYPASELRISEIELASQVRRARPAEREKSFLKHGLYVEPYPYRTLERHQPIDLYFEIYGLTLDALGNARYRVDYEVTAGKRGGVLAILSALNPFKGAGARMTSSYEYVGRRPHRYDYLSVDLSALEPGTYRLKLTVFDRVAEARTSTEIRFEIGE